jgi:hypothetical protein
LGKISFSGFGISGLTELGTGLEIGFSFLGGAFGLLKISVFGSGVS